MVEKICPGFGGKKGWATSAGFLKCSFFFFVVVLLGAPRGQASYYTLLIMEDMN